MPNQLDTMRELILCLDCVSEFKVDCTTRAAVPALASYPCECNPAAVCGNGFVEPGEACDGAGCPSGNCQSDCTCGPLLCCTIGCTVWPGFGQGCVAAGGSIVPCGACQLAGDCCLVGGGPCVELDAATCAGVGGIALACPACPNCCAVGSDCVQAAGDECADLGGAPVSCDTCWS